MPRFVLLYHDCPPAYPRRSHWDFMLEGDSVLRTWALERLPRDWSAACELTKQNFPTCLATSSENRVAAERLGDHRSEYLTLEGAVSSGRGHVQRIDAGAYEIVAENACEVHARLNGTILRGPVVLTPDELTVAKV